MKFFRGVFVSCRTILCVAMFSCCTFCAFFSCCTFFPVACFSCCNIFLVRLFSCCTFFHVGIFSCCTFFRVGLFSCCTFLLCIPSSVAQALCRNFFQFAPSLLTFSWCPFSVLLFLSLSTFHILLLHVMLVSCCTFFL